MKSRPGVLQGDGRPAGIADHLNFSLCQGQLSCQLFEGQVGTDFKGKGGKNFVVHLFEHPLFPAFLPVGTDGGKNLFFKVLHLLAVGFQRQALKLVLADQHVGHVQKQLPGTLPQVVKTLTQAGGGVIAPEQLGGHIVDDLPMQGFDHAGLGIEIAIDGPGRHPSFLGH